MKMLNTKYKKIIFLFIGVVIFISLIYKANDIFSYLDKRAKNQKYEKMVDSLRNVKHFENLDVVIVNSKAEAKITWKDGSMYYKIRIDIYNYIRLSKWIENYNLKQITVCFLDDNNFELYKLEINPEDMVEVVDEKNRTIGCEVNSKVKISPELYKDFKTCELSVSVGR